MRVGFGGRSVISPQSPSLAVDGVVFSNRRRRISSLDATRSAILRRVSLSSFRWL